MKLTLLSFSCLFLIVASQTCLTSEPAGSNNCHYLQNITVHNFFNKKADGCVNDLLTRFREITTADSGSTANINALLRTRRTKANCVTAGIPSTVPASSNTILLPSSDTTDVLGTARVTTVAQNPPVVTPTVAVTPIVAPARTHIQVRMNGDVGIEQLSGMRLCLGAVQPGDGPSAKCSRGCDNSFYSALIERHFNSTTEVLVSIPWMGQGQAVSAQKPWNHVSLEFEQFARPVCIFSPVLNAQAAPADEVDGAIAADATQWFGFHVAVSYSCADSSNVRKCQDREIPTATALASSFNTAVNSAQLANVDVPLYLASMQQRKNGATCCERQHVIDTDLLIPDNVPNPDVVQESLRTIVIGVCIDPTVETCCGGSGINAVTESCCSGDMDPTRFVDGHCECRSGTDCGSSEACCLDSRPAATERIGSEHVGSCYNTGTHQCCDNGAIFNPGSMQCCPVNGLQTLDEPCPCNVAGDCPNSNQDCCSKVGPALSQFTQPCERVANFKMAVAPLQGQKCTGTCFDTRYETCCNGAICMAEYESCCHDTCCNKFSQSCRRGRSESSFLSDPTDVNVVTDTCDSIEKMTPLAAALAYLVPTGLLVGILASLALALVFVNKSSASNHQCIEVALMVVAGLAILASLFLLFSPLLEVAVLASLAALVAIFAAGARLKWLNIFAIVLLGLAILYMVDPFNGSHALGLSRRTVLDDPDFHGVDAGAFRSIAKAAMPLRNADRLGNSHCTNWYGYFRTSTALTDDRIDNPEENTFGLCARGWLTALLFLAGFLLLLLLVALVLAILALGRFKKLVVEPIELEITGGPAGAPVF